MLKIPTIEWNALLDDTRNAAMRIHIAKQTVKGLQASETAKPNKEAWSEALDALVAAREEYAKFMSTIQGVLIDGIDISYLDCESSPPAWNSEVLLDEHPPTATPVVPVETPTETATETPATV